MNLFCSLHSWKDFPLELVGFSDTKHTIEVTCLSPPLYIENLQSCERLVILKLYLQWTWFGIQAYQRAQRSLIASTLYTATALPADTELDSLCQLFLSASPRDNYVLCSFRLPNSSQKKKLTPLAPCS